MVFDIDLITFTVNEVLQIMEELEKLKLTIIYLSGQ